MNILKYFIKSIFNFIVLLISFIVICIWGIHIGVRYSDWSFAMLTSGELSLGLLAALAFSAVMYNYIKGRLFVLRTDEQDTKSSDYLDKLEKMTNTLHAEDLRKERNEFKNYNLYNMILSITNTIPDMIWMKDVNGRYQFLNKQLSQGLYGIDDPKDCIGKTDVELGEISINNGVNVDFVKSCIDSDSRTIMEENIVQTQEVGNSANGYVYLDVIKTPFYEHDRLVGTVGIGRNVTNRVKRLESIKIKDEILETVGYASEVFLRDIDWKNNFNKILEQLGTNLNCERVYVYKKYHDKQFKLRASWGSGHFEQYLDFENNNLNRWYETLNIGRPIKGLSKFFPDKEKELLDKIGVNSVLILPIFVEKEFWGFIGFDDYNEKEWDDVEIRALKSFSNLIESAIMHSNTIKAIHNKEETFRTIFNVTQSGLILINSDSGNIIDTNKAAIDLLGCKQKNDIVGMYYGDAFCELTIDQVNRATLEIVDNFHCTCVDWKKKNRHCIKSVTPLVIDGVDHVLVSFIDISDKLEIQNKISEHDKYYKKFIERFNGIMFKFEIPSLDIEYIGPRAYDHFDIKYNNVEQDLRQYVPDYHVDKFDMIIQEMKNGIIRPELDFKVIDKHDNEVWFEQINNVIYDDDDNVICVEGLFRNMTRRRKSEIELANKTKFMDTLFDTIPIPFYFKDVNGVYQITNKEFNKLCRRNVVGETVDGNFNYDDGKFFIERDNELYNDPSGYQTYEHTFKFPNEQISRHMKFYRSIVKDSGNNILGIIGTSLDMTELYTAKNDLNYQKDLLSAIFKNALTPIFVKDENGKYLMYNDSFKKMSGLTDTKTYDHQLYDESTINKIREKDLHVINNQTDVIYESLLTTLHDSSIRYGITKKSHIPNTRLLTGSIKDLTKEKVLIDDLKFREFVSMRTLNIMTNIIYVVDTKLNIQLYNKSFEQWCKPSGSLIGKYLFSQFLLLSNNIRKEYEEVISTKTGVFTEDIVEYDGKRIKFDSRKLPIFDEHGNVNLIATITKIFDEES
jgi:PAS domain S-box-containing protein